MKVRLRHLGLWSLLMLSVLVGPRLDSASIPQTVSVGMKSIQFVPAIIRINVGDTVTWTNMDQVQHTVTSATRDYNFSSPLLGPGEKFAMTFDRPGVAVYYCAVHPSMLGRIYVGVDPPRVETGSDSSNSPGMTLLMDTLGDGRIVLTASLEVSEGPTAGIPVSFFARYYDNRTTFWLRLDTVSTQLDGSAQLVIPGRADETGFQAYASQIGGDQGVYSNVVELDVPRTLAVPNPFYYQVSLFAAAFGILLTILLVRRSRSSRAGEAYL